MVCGMILAGTAFMLAGVVQIKVDVSMIYRNCIHTCCMIMHTKPVHRWQKGGGMRLQPLLI